MVPRSPSHSRAVLSFEPVRISATGAECGAYNPPFVSTENVELGAGLDLRARLTGDGVTGQALGAEGDRAAHELLMRRLAELRPHDAVLSEEGAADPARLAAERVWIVDPLDGTREFGEVPRTDWAVHVALVVGGDPGAGAVALPARGLTLATATPPPPPAAWTGPVRVVVSRSRPRPRRR